MASPKFYLALPWKSNPDLSFEKATKWMYQLRRMGHYVFSPINHTHPYWKALRESINEDMDETELEEIQQYLEKEDWLEWDLEIFESFMDGAGFTQFKCVKCGGIRDYSFHCCGEITQKQYYDSGVILLLSRTAYTITNKYEPNIKTHFETYNDLWRINPGNAKVNWKSCWNSDGCRQEYEFAKDPSRNIRVLELESFLEGKEVDL